MHHERATALIPLIHNVVLRHPGDAQGIGILLRRTRDRVTVEYALRNTATCKIRRMAIAESGAWRSPNPAHGDR
jgi:hypothetical protein